MGKKKRPAVVCIICQCDAGVVVPLVFKNIVVAFNQEYFQIMKTLPPLPEPVQLRIGMAVKKIAHNDQLCRFEILKELNQPLKVFTVNALGYRDARLPEMSRLAKMKI